MRMLPGGLGSPGCRASGAKPYDEVADALLGELHAARSVRGRVVAGGGCILG
jgi:hypothetical protein